MKNKLHSLESLPEGKTVGDIYPAFSKVVKHLRIGKRSTCCAACRKQFNAVRKPRGEILLYAIDALVPFAIAYPLCGGCASRYRQAGMERESILAAVESFHNGEKASQ